jgi:tetratricopeptide (TPR) repeat protein
MPRSRRSTNSFDYADIVLAEAEAICHAGLGGDPSRPDLLHARGLLAARAGQLDFAALCLRRALKLDCRNSRYALDLGDLLDRTAKHRDAIDHYLYALTLRQDDGQTLRRLGLALSHHRCYHASRLAYAEAQRLAPGDLEIEAEIGDVFLAQGQISEAIECYQRTLRLGSPGASVYRRLAQAYAACKNWAEAVLHFRTALRHEPREATLHVGLGRILFRLGQTDQAIDAFRAALSIRLHDIDAAYGLVQAVEVLGRRTDLVGAWCHLAACYANAGQFSDAATAYRQAIAHKPDCLKAWVKLGQALLELAQPCEALRAYRVALTIDPDHIWAHQGVGWASLCLGDFETAWPETAWSQRDMERDRRDFEQPVWDGRPLNGQRILLWADQALGDAVQAIRYVKFAKDAGGHVMVEAYPSLMPMIGRMPWVDEVVLKGGPLPQFDCHLPLGSLARVCWQLRPAIPAAVPYVIGDARLVNVGRERLGSSRKPRIGLVWAGAPSRPNSPTRNATLAAFEPLGRVGDARFISLQLGPQVDELLAPPPGLAIETCLDAHSTIDETVALMHELDLVITVDTMIANLAGALGLSAWVVLSYAPDWRWLSEGETTPWYPTLRLFRQARPRDWRELLQRVAAALEQHLAERPIAQVLLRDTAVRPLFDA